MATAWKVPPQARPATSAPQSWPGPAQQLGGGPPAEGEQQHPLRGRALGHEAGDAGGERGGLAGARAGDHQQVAAVVLDGVALRVGEAGGGPGVGEHACDRTTPAERMFGQVTDGGGRARLPGWPPPPLPVARPFDRRFVVVVASALSYFLGLGILAPVLPALHRGRARRQRRRGRHRRRRLRRDRRDAAAVGRRGRRPAGPARPPGRRRAGRRRGHARLRRCPAASAVLIVFRLLAGAGEAAAFIGAATTAQDLAPPDRRGPGRQPVLHLRVRRAVLRPGDRRLALHATTGRAGRGAPPPRRASSAPASPCCCRARVGSGGRRRPAPSRPAPDAACCIRPDSARGHPRPRRVRLRRLRLVRAALHRRDRRRRRPVPSSSSTASSSSWSASSPAACPDVLGTRRGPLRRRCCCRRSAWASWGCGRRRSGSTSPPPSTRPACRCCTRRCSPPSSTPRRKPSAARRSPPSRCSSTCRRASARPLLGPHRHPHLRAGRVRRRRRAVGGRAGPASADHAGGGDPGVRAVPAAGTGRMTGAPTTTVWLVYRAGFGCGLYLGVTTLALSLIDRVGVGPLALALVGTTLEVAYFLAEVPTGVVADRRGRKPSILIGLVGVGIGFCLDARRRRWPSCCWARCCSAPDGPSPPAPTSRGSPTRWGRRRPGPCTRVVHGPSCSVRSVGSPPAQPSGRSTCGYRCWPPGSCSSHSRPGSRCAWSRGIGARRTRTASRWPRRCGAPAPRCAPGPRSGCCCS